MGLRVKLTRHCFRLSAQALVNLTSLARAMEKKCPTSRHDETGALSSVMSTVSLKASVIAQLREAAGFFFSEESFSGVE
jgi:hypothetical protein